MAKINEVYTRPSTIIYNVGPSYTFEVKVNGTWPCWLAETNLKDQNIRNNSYEIKMKLEN